jgi:hypothetical protein
MRDGGEEPPVAAPADFPEDWRDKLAGEDEKARALLDRYASPADILKAHMALRAKMDSGEGVRAKPDEDDEEGMKAWREEVGIPEDPGGYLDTLPDGLVIGEEDELLASSFMEAAHAKDLPPEAVHLGLQWYYDMQENQVAEQVEADRDRRIESEEALRAEWGSEFRPNIQGTLNMLDAKGGEGFKDKLFTARMADGTLFGDDPDVLRFLVGINRELNPFKSVTPAAGQTAVQTVQAELIELRNEMKDQHSDYYKNENKQARYRELLEMEDRYKARATG